MNDQTAKADNGKPTYTLVPPANTAKHIEAINTAIRALGGKATMVEIWTWAKQPEKEVNEC